MSNRKYKSSSQSTYEKGVAPARGKEQDKRNTATEAASPALTPAPPLALRRRSQCAIVCMRVCTECQLCPFYVRGECH